MTLNRTDVIAQIADRTDLSRSQAEAALAALQEVLTDALREGRAVRLPGLFTAERTERAARTGRNPRTGEPLDIPAGYGVRLAAATALKDAARG